MTIDPTNRSNGSLRQRMIEDMRLRGFVERTRINYLRHAEALAAFLGRSTDTATAEDLRRFQLHQSEAGVGTPTLSGAVMGAAHCISSRYSSLLATNRF